MNRSARTLVCAVVMFGGLYMLCRSSFDYDWTPDQIVGSVAALTAVCVGLEIWRTRA